VILFIIKVQSTDKLCWMRKQIFNTYGTLSNAALLHRYGFTEPNNPFDIVNMEMTLVLDIASETYSARHNRRCLAL
jgi:SET domain-containing protein 6